MTRTPGASGTAASWLYLGRGLYLATLLLVLSPTPSLGGGFSDTGALVSTRFAFFCAFAVSALVTTALWKRLSPARLHSGFIAAAMIVQIVGGLGYPLTAAGVLPQQFLTVDLLLSALVLPIIDLAWGEAYAQLPLRSIIARTAGSLALAVAVLALIQVLPGTWSVSFMKLLPLGSILLIVVLRRSPSSPPYVALTGGLGTMQPSWKLLAGICCAMAASAILPGSAETGGFISWWSDHRRQRVGRGAHRGAARIEAPGRLPESARGVRGHHGRMLRAVGAAHRRRFGRVVRAVQNRAALHHPGHAAVPVHRAVVHPARHRAEDAHQPVSRMRARPDRHRAVGRAIGTGVGMLAPLDPAALSILALLILVPGMYFFATSDHPTEVIVDAEDVLQRRLDRIVETTGLTAREREILELWVTGHRLDYVAESLFISKNTVKTHLRHIYQKTQTGNKEELLVLFEQQA